MECFSKRCGTVEETSYMFDSSYDISRIAEVRCTKWFGFRANSLTNFALSSVLKVENLGTALAS